MIGNRPSLLETTIFCPLAGRIATGAAGRAAFVSTVHHAMLANDPRAHDLFVQLTPAEREDVLSRKAPVDVVFEDGRALRWADAHHETRVGLTRELKYCLPDSPEAITAGTADAWWDPLEGTVYVPDIKATERTSHVDSLQLHAYGHALASMVGAESYCPGIWAATEGTWQWGEIVVPGSPEAWDVEDRLLRAITNTEGPGCTGPHCESCWSRLKCPEYVLPGAQALGDLACLSAPEAITPDQAVQLIQLRSKAQAVLDSLTDTLKAISRREGGILDPSAQKLWKGCATAGRETVDLKALRAALGPDAEQYIRRSEGYETFRWVNAPGATKKARKK